MATHAALGAVDFGDQLVTEAVDLAAAHAHDSVEQSQEMQDLLHWAIGASCRTPFSGHSVTLHYCSCL